MQSKSLITKILDKGLMPMSLRLDLRKLDVEVSVSIPINVDV